MKVCAKCGNENPSSALHCMKCGNLLVEEERLTEEQRLQKKLQDTEKENELLKAALEAQLKGSTEKSNKDTHATDICDSENEKAPLEFEEDKIDSKEEVINVQPIQNRDNTDSIELDTQSHKKTSNRTLLLLIIALFLVAGIVGGLIYRTEIYLPAKRDAEAPRYYVVPPTLNIRNSPFFDGDANKIGSVSYGTELIVYDSTPGEYFHCKFCPKDARGKVIKENVIEGYVHYDYLLPKNDFFLLNSIFGNDDAKKMLSETRYKRALLQFFKQNNYIGNLTEEQSDRYGFSKKLLQGAKGRYQVFCHHPKATCNNVYRSRKYRKDSKYPDAAIILDNLDNENDRLLLYYTFNDDGSYRLLITCHIQNRGYMKDGTLKLFGDEVFGYKVAVEFEE